MVRRALSAVLVAFVVAALPVGWLLMSRASVAVADDGDGGGDGGNGHDKHATATVTATRTVVQTVVATTTVVHTVRATSTVARTTTATAHSVTTSTSTVAQPGPTVVRTLPGGQVVHTVVATTTASASATSAFDAANRGLPVDDSGGSPMWPYFLGIIVLGLAGTVGLLMSSRQ